MPPAADYRSAIADYIRANALPVDKYAHQPRLYALAKRLGDGMAFDDDVLYAAAWLHDLGVFVGHRPEDPEQLARWDHVAYVNGRAPELLRGFGFPAEKIAAVCETIAAHLPTAEPETAEGVLLRDADILEQLGAVAILRNGSKVGRDTRFFTHGQVVELLRRNLRELPGKLRLPQSRALAGPRVQILEAFLAAVDEETGGVC